MEFINTINTMLTDNLGPFGPLIVVGVLGVILIGVTIPFFLAQKSDPLEKLKRSNQAASQTASGEKLRFENKNDKLEKYSDFLEPQDEEEYSAVKLRLLQAGYKGHNAVRMYYFAQFALGLGLLALGIFYTLFLKNSDEAASIQSMLLPILLPGVAGYMAPKWWVNKRLTARKTEIENGFPDSLDMMLVCVEAGQSMDQSIIRVARELRAGFPALAEEYEIVAHEMKAGKDRVQVLRDMSERAGVTDVASFVTVLIQSATFGTSIADALRVFSAEMRDKRVMRAEEAANKLPTKMTLATMMMTVPPLLIILIGPSIYSIYETLQNVNF